LAPQLALTAMPGNETRAPSFSAGLVRRRPESEADGEFRFDLFCGSRPPGEELSDLDAPVRALLMRQQFRGQAASYHANYPGARFEIVEHDGAPIGRIVTARAPDALLIVDIALIASWRRRGIGAILVKGVLDEARAAGLPVRLAVFASNALAQRFYLRLGFKPVECSGIGIRLKWREPSHPEAKA
jgi:GNAT superfamily N-acetyltransferase